MKTVNKLTAILLLLLMGLLFGCQNPVGPVGPEESVNGGGTFSLKYIIPDYDHDLSATSTGSRVISPNTYELRVYLDGTEFMTIVPTPAVEYNQQGTSGPVVWEGQINGVPADDYDIVTIEPLDSTGQILTSGSAYQVSVAHNEIVPLTISCLVAQDAYDFLTVGGESFTGTAAESEMVFYKFYGRKDTVYTISIEATSGTPDLYLFGPTGAHTGESDFGNDGYEDIAYTATQTGTYTIGVYGWGELAEYSLTVTSSVVDPAQTYVDLAFGAMRDMDWDGALSQFSRALIENPSHPDAVMGYSLVSLARIMIDPDMADLAQNKLGLVRYPSTLNELFSSDWLSGYVMAFSDSDEYSFLFPDIVGQDAWDGFFRVPDGIISPDEKAMAMLAFFATHNTGFDDILGTLTGVLGGRLDHSIAALEQVLDGASLTLTWDMLFDTWDQAAAWPQDFMGTDDFMEVTLGKAELQVMASFLEIIKTMAYLIGSYDLDLVKADGSNLLQQYWDYFNPVDGTLYGSGSIPVDTPFSITDFLSPSNRAASYLVEARDSMLSGLDMFGGALGTLRDRAEGSPYMLDNELADTLGLTWTFVQDVCNFMIRQMEQVEDSITLNQSAFLVIPNVNKMMQDLTYLEGFLEPNDWPDSADLLSSDYRVLELNFAPFFVSPLSFPVDLAPNGEPVWYTLDGTTMRPITLFEMGQIDPASTQTEFFMCFPDISCGGIFPVNTLPMDDPSTLAECYLYWDDDYFTDERAGNGVWDPSERIYQFDVFTDIEGPYDMGDLASYPSGDPLAYYDLSAWEDADALSYLNTFTTTDPAHPLEEYATDANMAALISAIKTYLESNSAYYGTGDYMPFVDGNSLYLSPSSYIVWHSVTPQGTPGVNSNGRNITSMGSFWWYMAMPY